MAVMGGGGSCGVIGWINYILGHLVLVMSERKPNNECIPFESQYIYLPP